MVEAFFFVSGEEETGECSAFVIHQEDYIFCKRPYLIMDAWNKIDFCVSFPVHFWADHLQLNLKSAKKYINGSLYYEYNSVWSHFMDNHLFTSKEDHIPQALVWFLQPDCFYDSCNFSCYISISLRSRFQMPSLSFGCKIFPKAGIWHLIMGLLCLKPSWDSFS